MYILGSTMLVSFTSTLSDTPVYFVFLPNGIVQPMGLNMQVREREREDSCPDIDSGCVISDHTRVSMYA
jgi:hypothetical protein